MERRQKMIEAKLAEIGVSVQGPVQFVKIPHGPIGGQIAFIWDDTATLQAVTEQDDEFAQIAAAMRAEEAAEREAARLAAEEQARIDLERLADGILDDDDEDDE